MCISTAIHDISKHALDWYENNQQFHDYALFVEPDIWLQQTAYMLDMFCYYHVFGTIDKKREELLWLLKQLALDQKYGQ